MGRMVETELFKKHGFMFGSTQTEPFLIVRCHQSFQVIISKVLCTPKCPSIETVMTILQDLEARNTIQEYRRLFIETSPSYTCISTNGIDSTRLYMCLKDIATINAGDQGLKGLAFDCEK